MNTSLLTEQEGRVLRLTLNRPEKRNALNEGLCRSIVEAVEAAQSNAGIGSILLAANGNVFCAGMDLAEALAPDAVVHTAIHERLFTMLEWTRKPIIAQVGGPALGGGVGLIANSHLAIAAHGTSFGLTEIRIGMWPYFIYGSIEAAIGVRRALELSLTGRIFQLPEAVQWGLIAEAAPSIELEDRAYGVAAHIAGFSSETIRSGLEFVDARRNANSAERRNLAHSFRSATFASDDFREGVTAFLEKRKPGWTHRS